MKSIIVLFLLFSSSELFACNCRGFGKIDNEAISKAKDIFIGTVLKIESFDSQRRKVIFQLNERLKTDSTAHITIITGLGGGDCGLNVKEGQKWYVFATAENGISYAGVCGRSALLSDQAIEKKTYKKYYRRAAREYNRHRKRAYEEMNFIKAQTAANTSFYAIVA